MLADAGISELAQTSAALFEQRDQLPHHREARSQILISLMHIWVGQKGIAQLSPAGVVSGDGVFNVAHFMGWGRDQQG